MPSVYLLQRRHSNAAATTTTTPNAAWSDDARFEMAELLFRRSPLPAADGGGGSGAASTSEAERALELCRAAAVAGCARAQLRMYRRLYLRDESLREKERRTKEASHRRRHLEEEEEEHSPSRRKAAAAAKAAKATEEEAEGVKWLTHAAVQSLPSALWPLRRYPKHRQTA